MTKPPTLDPTSRDLAVARLRRITLGVGIAGLAGIGGFGWVAATSNPGHAQTADTTTPDSQTDPNLPAFGSDPLTQGSDDFNGPNVGGAPAPTSNPQQTSPQTLRGRAQPPSTGFGRPHVRTGGSGS